MMVSPCDGEALNGKCCNESSGSQAPRASQQEHVWLISGRAKSTEGYHPKLVAAVLKAIRAQLQADRDGSTNAVETGI